MNTNREARTKKRELQVIFGWLFWRRTLEAAMVAHAVTHLAWSAVALAAFMIG